LVKVNKFMIILFILLIHINIANTEISFSINSGYGNYKKSDLDDVFRSIAEVNIPTNAIQRVDKNTTTSFENFFATISLKDIKFPLGILIELGYESIPEINHTLYFYKSSEYFIAGKKEVFKADEIFKENVKIFMMPISIELFYPIYIKRESIILQISGGPLFSIGKFKVSYKYLQQPLNDAIYNFSTTGTGINSKIFFEWKIDKKTSFLLGIIFQSIKLSNFKGNIDGVDHKLYYLKDIYKNKRIWFLSGSEYKSLKTSPYISELREFIADFSGICIRTGIKFYF